MGIPPISIDEAHKRIEERYYRGVKVISKLRDFEIALSEMGKEIRQVKLEIAWLKANFMANMGFKK